MKKKQTELLLNALFAITDILNKLNNKGYHSDIDQRIHELIILLRELDEKST